MLTDWVLLVTWMVMTASLSAIATKFMLNRDRARRRDERDQWMARMVEERELTEVAIQRYADAQQAWATALLLAKELDDLKAAEQ